MIGKAFAAIVGRWQLSLGILAAVVLALALSYCKGSSDGRELTEAEYAAARAQAVAQARKADGVARASVERDRARSGAEIERGREAAAGADDPWAAAVEAMR